TLAASDSRGSSQRMAVAEYERLFSRQGLDVHQAGTAWFVSGVHSSTAPYALLARLDNWALLAYRMNDPQLGRLPGLARAADPDCWRGRFRDSAVWSDRDTLAELAREPDIGRQSPTVVACLAWLLWENETDPSSGMHEADLMALYERALLGHPRDFWL